MLRQRFLVIALVIWLLVLFSIERYSLSGINLPTLVYIVAAMVMMVVLIVPDFILIRWYVILTPVLTGYGLYRYFTIENTSLMPSLLFIMAEGAIIALSFALSLFISRQIADTERTYDALVMNTESSRVLNPVKGEEMFNHELLRARQYDRPFSLLVVQPPSVKDLSKLYKNHLSYQVSLQHRYITSRIAQLSEALLYSTDPITMQGDHVVIGLPETNADAALNLARRIAAVVHASLGVTVQIGIVELSKERPLFQDMLSSAKKNMYAFILPVNTNGDDLPPPTRTRITDDDTMPIPYLDEDGTIALNEDGDQPAQLSGTDQARTTRKDDIEPNGENISPYQRIVAMLVGAQLFPLKQLRIQTSATSKSHYDPDFWVNRLPYQSRASRIIYSYIKRLMDILLILLVSPAILLVSGLIALFIFGEDRGPVLYAQERTGLGNRKFKMWRFRSMIIDANNPEKLAAMGVYLNASGEAVDAEGNKLKDDPRFTRIGHFIRKTNLDELPQLWNIFIGDMSLVGPRPTSLRVEHYEMPQAHSLIVKPGLTGLWHVYDLGTTDFNNRLIWDMRYVDKMCLWLDLQILFLTMSQRIVKRRGAS
ncbi:MAG: sugar transferase [Anaerolineae bacterium]